MSEESKKKLGRPRKYFNENGKDGAPSLNIRFEPDLYAFICSRPEGVRQFLESLVRLEMSKVAMLQQQEVLE